MLECAFRNNNRCMAQLHAPECDYSDPSECTIAFHGTVTPIETNSKKVEKVNHPKHYNNGGIECIDALAAATEGLPGIEAFCTANAIKYLWRWKWKNGVEDLDKAIWYINRLKEHLAKTN